MSRDSIYATSPWKFAVDNFPPIIFREPQLLRECRENALLIGNWGENCKSSCPYLSPSHGSWTQSCDLWNSWHKVVYVSGRPISNVLTIYFICKNLCFTDGKLQLYLIIGTYRILSRTIFYLSQNFWAPFSKNSFYFGLNRSSIYRRPSQSWKNSSDWKVKKFLYFTKYCQRTNIYYHKEYSD